MYLLTSAILSATAKRINFVFPNKFCLCSGPKEPTLSELCRTDLQRGQVVAVPAHGQEKKVSRLSLTRKQWQKMTYQMKV
jgi:hypothetical protein